MRAAAGRSVHEEAERERRVRSGYPHALSGSLDEVVMRAGGVVEVTDALNGADSPAPVREIAHTLGYSYSLMAAPLLWEGRSIGTIGVVRRVLGGFHPKERTLLRSFADQAVIAIQNARLFNETKEALEQQKASADVLEVISGSMGDAAPVFDAILLRCEQLITDAAGSSVALIGDDGLLRVGCMRFSATGRAAFSTPADADAAVQRMRTQPAQPLAGTTSEAAIRAGHSVTYPDVVNGADVPESLRSAARLIGETANFAAAVVPLIKDGRALGTITVTTLRLGEFNPKELALLEMFADQAVVALENARLFNETQRSLERQTATAEILKVIAGSPDNVQPVFDAIARSSNRLLGGHSTMVARIFGDALHMVAFTPTTPQGDEALKRSFPIALATFPVGGAIWRGEIVHIVDTEQVADDMQRIRDLARARGYRSMLFCPLLRDREPIGMISVTRREPGTFASHQVELLQTFADQAVIAIENVRLFNETKEALARQTATADILLVISASVADAQPVFEKIVDSGQHLFDGDALALFTVDDAMVHLRAMRGDWATPIADSYPRPVAQTAFPQVTHQRHVLYFPDVLGASDVPVSIRHFGVVLGNVSVLVAAMRWKGDAIGAVTVTRRPPAPFAEKEMALLQTFADQAVIAIQNARMFNETKEALERQTATADVLRVISRSVSNAAPVFEEIMHSC